MRQRFSENAVERMKTAELICSLVMGRTTVSELPQDLTFVEKEYLGD